MRTALAAALTAALVASPVASNAADCRSLSLSTGPFAVGYPDPLWTVLKPGQAAALPAATVNRYSGWLNPIAPSKWISSAGYGNGTTAASPVGTYVYEVILPLPSDVTYAAVHGDFAVDNDVSFEVVNDAGTTVVGGFVAPPGGDSQAWALYHPLYAPDGTFRAGQVNRLRAKVVNRGQRDGLTFYGWLYFCR